MSIVAQPSYKSTHFISLTTLADVLSLSKSVIESKVKRGEIPVSKETGLVNIEDVAMFEPVKQMLNSQWNTESQIKPAQDYKLIELFAGCGGLALGMEEAGLKGVLYSEIDKSSCETLKCNRPDWNVVVGDVANLDFSSYEGGVDVLTGGFPCQAFSYAGKSLGFEDTRGTLFFEMARAIKESQPKIFVAENVRALVTHDNGNTLKTIFKIIDDLGYEVVGQRLMKAIFYKVPQKRERFIIVGVRKDLVGKAEFKFPSTYNRIMTLRDAFYAGELFDSDVPESEFQKYPKRKAEIMAHVPPGGYWKDLPDDLQREYMKGSYFLGGGKTGIARRLSLDEPSLTLTTAPAQKQTERCHPLYTRPLSVREYARIQTFSDNWKFKGTITSIYKQIGNAVPVNMAAAIGRSVVRYLNELELKET